MLNVGAVVNVLVREEEQPRRLGKYFVNALKLLPHLYAADILYSRG